MAAIVQQAQGSVVTNYGIGTTAISTGTASALVAFIGWNYGTSGTYVATPAVSVCDSAGNLWKQIGITQGGTSAAQNVRCAIWATVRAQPVSWVSVGLTGYTSAAAWTIAEISGLPQAVSLDFSIGTAGTGISPSLSWTASGSDIGFLVLNAGNGSAASASLVPGWSALSPTAAGTAATGCAILPYWNQNVIAGGSTTSLTLTTSATFSYALCTISGTASPPAQYDIRHPLNIIEAAFGAAPGNPSSSVDYTFSSENITWTDISTRVIGSATQSRLAASRGRQYELQQEETGEMNVYLDNHDGAFTPTNPGSPYYSNALNSNMSFQSGISGWSPGSGAALAQSSAFAFASGLNAVAVYSMQVTPGASNSSAHAVNVVINLNYSYSGSCWVYSPGGWASGAHIQVNWSTASGTFISTTTGSSIALPAGQWTLVSSLNMTPPATAGQASLIISLAGSPTSANVYYVAEAALVTGSQAVSTGLVALKTPVRITTWWQGRQWPLWMGYAERWPQSWPEMPQWGFSKLVLTDALGIMAAGLMNSALIGEVLIDSPYAYLPCNEQYTTATVGATPAQPFLFGTSPTFAPADANGLIALNKALGNQITGTYFDGNNQQASTGLAMNFLGDDGTGMGATGYGTTEVDGLRGPSMLYSDTGLQTACGGSNGFTTEFWFTWDGSNQSVTLLTGYGAPSAFMYTGIGNDINGSMFTVWIDGAGPLLALNAVGLALSLTASLTPSQSPQHCVLVFTAGASPAITMWLNGVNQGNTLITPGVGAALQALVLGPGRYSYDCNVVPSYTAYNFSAGHLAVYPYQLSSSRIQAHYEAGATGWAGVSAAYRFAQILTWGQLGLKRGGYYTATATGNPEITLIGPAYQLGGATASDAINSVAQSEGGTYFVKGDGTIVYQERVIGYNQAVSATLGDNATAAPDVLNSNPGFLNASITGWTGINATPSYSPQMYGQYGSLQIVSGTVNAYAVSPAGHVISGGTYTTGTWVLAPNGGTITAGLRWTGGSFSTSQVIPPSCWNFIQASGTVPAGAGVSSASMFAGLSGTAATMLMSYGYFMQQSPEIPYLKDTEFDLDDTYVYNEVTAIQIDGPNQLIEYDTRNTASQQQYFRRSALSFQSIAASPYDISDITTWSSAQFAQPVIHATAIRIHASADPLVIFPVLLTLDIGDIVQINRRPVGGAIISELGIIERIQYEIGARYFYVTFQVSPYQPANNVLCADTAGFDTPGTTTLGW